MSNPQVESETDTDPAEVTEEETSEPVSDSEQFTIPGQDVYEAGDPAHVLMKGYTESYDQYFLILFYVVLEEDHVQLEDMIALSGQQEDVIHRVTLDQSPGDIKVRMHEVLNGLQETEVRDSQNFENKLERNLKQRDQLETLCEPLRSGDTELFKNNLRELMIDEIFPGSKLELSSRVISPHQEIDQTDATSGEAEDEPEEESEEDSSDQETEEVSDTVLKVTPEYDPIDGVRLEYLTKGDTFFVRVIGESVNELQEAFVEGDDPEKADRSKLLTGELETIEESPSKDTNNYRVRLDPNAVGKFSVNPAAKVRIRNLDELSWYVKFRRRMYYFIALLFIFLFSATISFFLFPDAIFHFFD